MKKTKVALVFATAVLGLASCKSKPEFKNIDGLEYMIVKDAEGTKKPAEGDFVEFHLVMKLDDSLITDTRKDQQGKPVQMPVQKSMFKGDWWTGLQLMTPGDSAIFLVSVDSMLAQMKKQQPGMETPPLLVGKKKIKYEVVLISVKSAKEMQAEQDAANSAQLSTDDQTLQAYLTKNNITAQKTASGLYYVITQEGTGDLIKAGQTAEMKYIGKTLDGKTFDANMGPDAKHTEVFPVPVGQGQVIRGWDEGLQLLKKGSKATFYIPSPLAYGKQAMGDMLPANSILIFDVEVVNVK